MQENGGGNLFSGRGDENRLATNNIDLTDDTWYTASFTWTPTSGLTGNASLIVNDFSSDVYTLSETGFTFDNAAGQIGFGSVNDTIRFDNVNFTGTAVPEPSSFALLSGLMAMGWMALRRRR